MSAVSTGCDHECAQPSPSLAPVGVPVIYEACDCPCHPAAGREAPKEATP